MTDDPLHRLNAKLNKLKAAQALKNAPSSRSSASYGMRAGMDLVSGVAVGTGVGYALDAWLDTLPWFSLICFGFGFAAGIRLMIETTARAVRALEEEEKRNKAQEPE